MFHGTGPDTVLLCRTLLLHSVKIAPWQNRFSLYNQRKEYKHSNATAKPIIRYTPTGGGTEQKVKPISQKSIRVQL